MNLQSAHSKIFCGVSISYKDIILSFVDIRFKTFFSEDIYIIFIVKYPNVFKVLLDLSPGFFWDNDYFIYAFCQQPIS